MRYDALIVGGGHNGLVAAAYLAQSGHHVAVFERRSLIGGAVSTSSEIVPGYRFDLGGSAHILIRLTPIVEELGLHRYGLEYVELDPLFFAPFPDGDALFIYRDVERTVQHLNDRFPGEGDAYRRFVDDWRDFSLTVRDAFLQPPTAWRLGKTMLFGNSTKLPWVQALRQITRPYGDVVRDYFSEPKVQAMLMWMAAQSGPPPNEPMTGPFVLWHPLYHEGGIARPRGGSGMLTQALKQHIEDHGGDVFLSEPVEEVIVRNGRAVGVRTTKREASARAVVAATHARETFHRLLPEEHRPAAAEGLRIGNGFGAVVRLALDRPVRYAAHPGDAARRGLQLICDTPGQIDSAYGDYLKGLPSEKPPIVAMTFSAVDDSLAPPGHEVLWLWAQYFPYDLRGDLHWDDIGDEVADHIIDTFEQYAPGTRDAIVGRLFQHPLWLERELGLFRGNVMHLEMGIDQMFALRPAVTLSNYRAHLKGLYLCGASTHPGGGIMGASGRNAASVVRRDLERRFFSLQ